MNFVRIVRLICLGAVLLAAIPSFSQEVNDFTKQEKKDGGALPRTTPEAENVNPEAISNYL